MLQDDERRVPLWEESSTSIKRECFENNSSVAPICSPCIGRPQKSPRITATQTVAKTLIRRCKM